MSEPARHTNISSLPIQDPELSCKLAKMEALIQRIPGMTVPIKKSVASCYVDSPFVNDIDMVEMPNFFSFPHMKMFDGTSDPDDHITQYRQRMFTIAIPCNMREACMCKGFGSSLIESTLQWYTNLPNNSISTFAKLTDTFVEQFVSRRKLERTAISAFHKGLCYDSDLYEELTKYPCKTMKDVLTKAWAHIQWEEGETNYYHSSLRKDTRRDSRVDKRHSDRRSEPYSYPNRSENRRREYNRSSETRLRDGPKIPEYNLSISPAEVIGVLKGLREKVKWPKRMRTPSDQ
ncbi:uncharacterized protein LOC133814874 [Humulus lupulus]|uniref:uncharacterized protein LOC133814874 n=1 Tax=Humulus lupulus TaxID=3486 RepID=UPI002B4151AE|nr:uncharacterized protein LOC133814874 [Humulus lupulus]